METMAPIEKTDISVASVDVVLTGDLTSPGEGAPLVVLCHHGVRSYRVVCWLREQGLTACQSMAGGIERWSAEVDPKVPTYS